jgi:hypothetical protein
MLFVSLFLERLANLFYVVLVRNFSGHGGSFGRRPTRGVVEFTLEATINVRSAVLTAQMGIPLPTLTRQRVWPKLQFLRDRGHFFPAWAVE